MIRRTAHLSLSSFAKINWVLKVLGRRLDGFHEVQTILQTIDLSDRIDFDLCRTGGIELKVSGRDVPTGPENLVTQAAARLRASCCVDGGVRVHLHKKIPLGAGLGGGSGNAAVTLMALNSLWDCGLSKDGLFELAADLGSDVPFFLVGGLALGLGRGESLTALAPRAVECEIVVSKPPLEMPSEVAYKLGNWSALGESVRLTKSELDIRIQRFCQAARFSEEGQLEDLDALLENDFDHPILAHFPPIAELKEEMLKAGCRKVQLCGSGSALMGLIAPGRREKVGSLLARGETFLAKTVNRLQYWAYYQEAGVPPLDA